jgi:hypothetical protein
VHDRCRHEEPRLAPVAAGHLVECFAVADSRGGNTVDVESGSDSATVPAATGQPVVPASEGIPRDPATPETGETGSTGPGTR